MVRAAGGVVHRESHGELEVALVHRPKYDDWSLPKGKLDPGEREEDAALREVEEETGFACTLGQELRSVTYRDRRGRPKVVRYWAMRPLGGEFTPTSEVDELRWLALEEAMELASYDRDAEVIRSLGGG